MFTLRSASGLSGVMLIVTYFASEGKFLMALVWYILAFKMFLNYPAALHQERTKLQMIPRRPTYSHLMFAHRGGSAEDPENTL